MDIQGKTVIAYSGAVITDTTKIDYYNKGWFVPSKAEWAAFADMAYTKMGVTTSNIGDYGLHAYCWTSARYNAYNAYYVDFRNGEITNYNVKRDYSARLGATF